jgi:hypothetical protein
MVKITNKNYPEDIFPPLKIEELHVIHEFCMKKFNFPIDRVSAYMMRKRDVMWMNAVKKLKESIKDSDAWPSDSWLWEEIDKAFEELM